MNVRYWVAMRSVELLAAIFVAGILIGGLAAGVPFLRSRIAEVILYGVACVAAVILRSALDLVAQGIVLVGQTARAVTRLRAPPQARAAGLTLTSPDIRHIRFTRSRCYNRGTSRAVG